MLVIIQVRDLLKFLLSKFGCLYTYLAILFYFPINRALHNNNRCIHRITEHILKDAIQGGCTGLKSFPVRKFFLPKWLDRYISTKNNHDNVGPFTCEPSAYESSFAVNGGGGGIRTHGGESPTPVFKTGALDHSATPPR